MPRDTSRLGPPGYDDAGALATAPIETAARDILIQNPAPLYGFDPPTR